MFSHMVNNTQEMGTDQSVPIIGVRFLKLKNIAAMQFIQLTVLVQISLTHALFDLSFISHAVWLTFHSFPMQYG